LPKAVTADGKPLPAGNYDVKLTAQEAAPKAVGNQTLERWVEFARNRKRAGREVVSIVPQAEIQMVVRTPRRRPMAPKSRSCEAMSTFACGSTKAGITI
jgi:hypothetical protein